MSAVQAAYLAGLFDGEGCVSIVKGQCRGNPAWALQMVVSNNLPAVLYKYRDITGAGFIHNRAGAGNRATNYSWRMSQTAAGGVLEQIQPYLEAKGDQVRIALEFLATFNHPPAGAKGLDAAIAQERDRLRVLLSRMKGTSGGRGRPKKAAVHG